MQKTFARFAPLGQHNDNIIESDFPSDPRLPDARPTEPRLRSNSHRLQPGEFSATALDKLESDAGK